MHAHTSCTLPPHTQRQHRMSLHTAPAHCLCTRPPGCTTLRCLVLGASTGSGSAAGPSPQVPGGVGPLTALYQQFQAWDDTSAGVTDLGDGSALLQQGGAAAAPKEWTWASYHSHEAMLQYLEQLAADSSGACSLEHVGDRWGGRTVSTARPCP